jgi:hypothetical protein
MGKRLMHIMSVERAMAEIGYSKLEGTENVYEVDDYPSAVLQRLFSKIKHSVSEAD